MNFLAGFFEWLSRINLYPYYDAWNITGVIFFLIWIGVTFIHLRPKLGFIKGGFFSFFFAFAWISMVDEVGIFLSINLLLQTGWLGINFASRWFWKFFFLYFCLKYIYGYVLPSKTVRISKTLLFALGLYWFWYFSVPYTLFYPYNFRSWMFTSYPRWFMFAVGHCTGWTFSTIIYLSIWHLDSQPDEYLAKWGIGETYMFHALKRRFNKIKEKYDINKIAEYETQGGSQDFPERDWDIIKSPDMALPYRLVFVFRPFPEIMKSLCSFMESGQMIMLSATSKSNLGYRIQKLLNVKGEYYSTKEELVKDAENYGLCIIESGYYDSPFWFDHSPRVIVPTAKFGMDQKLIKQMLIMEVILPNWFFAHHPYVIGRVP